MMPRKQRCPTCGGDRETPMLLYVNGGGPRWQPGPYSYSDICRSPFHRGEPVGFDVPFLSPRLPRGDQT